MKKEHFQEYFSGQTAIDLWEGIYEKGDIGAFSVRQRMRLALAWSDALGLGKNSRVLDAGCGAGLLSRELFLRGHGVFCLDYSFGMLKKAASACGPNGSKKVALFQGNIESMPFKSSSFDLIISLGVASYLKSFEKALGEYSRILSPSGVLIFSTLNKVNLVGLLDIPILLRNRLRKIHRKDRNADRPDAVQGPATKRFYFTPSVVKSLRRHGFNEITYETMPFRLLTLMGREIPPQRLNRRITLLLEKLPELPVIGPLGGLCLFMAKKNGA